MHGASDKRQQGDLAGLLDGQGKLTLMFCAGSCDPSGNDFTPFSDELSQCFGVFVIDFDTIVYAESADFTTLIEFTFSTASLAFIHNISPSS